MKAKKILTCALIAGMMISVCACGNSKRSSSGTTTSKSDSASTSKSETSDSGNIEDDFIWENDTVINGLSESGMQKTDLVIPSRCTGFDGSLNAEGSKVETISWESSVSSDYNLSTALQGVAGLKKIILPEGLETINAFAINNCEDLEEIVFPSTLKTIESQGVACNPLIEEIDLSGTQVESIGDYAFSFDKALTKITLSNSLNYMGLGAFPDSVTEIHMPSGMEIEDTSIQWIDVYDHDVATYVVEGSWADTNLDSWMNSDGSNWYKKNYE